MRPGRFADFIVRHHADGLPVPETLRRLIWAVLDHHDGQMADDATVLCLEWRGPSRNPAMRPADGAAATGGGVSKAGVEWPAQQAARAPLPPAVLVR
ncbi:hypothetical protein [Streptomyces sp. MK37H]|uniref:hypothetical protein n=1 Tax=Streptomyces sp. MK37H TaxID=2699117 RepID=UPI0035A8E2EB